MNNIITKPTPTAGESRDHFMSRCIPVVMEEGKPRDQAVAICSSLFENKKGVCMELLHKIFEAEVKSFDDQNLTIEHFISTETEDRSKDIMRADGMQMDGVPVVLKQHGFDADTGNEPIAKPLSITVGTNNKGVKGIVVKTKYFDGSKLIPPDNTGQRLYLKAKENFMPYWSIGFRGEDVVPKTNGGMEYKTWWLFEYSQVGVPDNIQAAVIKQMGNQELEEKANTIFKVGIEKEKKVIDKKKEIMFSPDETKTVYVTEFEKDGTKFGDTIEADSFEKAQTKADERGKGEIVLGELIEIIEKSAKSEKSTKLKTIGERVAAEIPWDAMRAIWFGMLDELESIDGSEKNVKAVLKEMIELITPHAIAFSQNTGNTTDTIEVKDIKEQINKMTYIDKKEESSDPAQDSNVDKSKPPVSTKEPFVLRVKCEPEKPKISLPCKVKELQELVSTKVKEEFRATVDKIRGKV